ncbi:MAG: LysM peptidoglycan-binding domain-containing protein [Anaerolineae bacterium]|nr:LysM peptidoglycan-binding domain-containing protein [Anaerolineae bacterium]
MGRKTIVTCMILIGLCWAILQPIAGVSAQTQIIHTVKPGENLFRIALYYGTSVDAIIHTNALSSVYIYVGQKLVIPGATNTAPPSEPLTPPTDAPPEEPTPVPTPGSPALDARTYIIQWGDTLSSIAIRFGVSIWDLMALNGLNSWSLIYAGQELIISDDVGEVVDPEPEVTPEPEITPVPEPTPVNTPDPTPTPVPETYTVQRGDTLHSIATRFGTTIYELARLNGIANPSLIYVGQKLRLTGSAPAPIGGAKLIVVDLSEQHMYVYQGDQLAFSFIVSTGRAGSYTLPGEYRVQSKIPNAYAATWNLWMPHWLGIYWAGSLENGIHALPLQNGQLTWAGWLGTPISYGCVILGTEEAALLYNWAEIGTPVSIRY